jgi:dTDP-glucose 4,6-dehydratase
MKIVVTGGAGFIGSALIRHVLTSTDHSVVNLDKLTYAGNLDSLGNVEKTGRYSFKNVDIYDAYKVEKALNTHTPDVLMHLAAESHYRGDNR